MPEEAPFHLAKSANANTPIAFGEQKNAQSVSMSLTLWVHRDKKLCYNRKRSRNILKYVAFLLPLSMRFSYYLSVCA